MTRLSLAAFLLATAALLSGCGSGEEAAAGTPPPPSPTISTVAILSLSANPITVNSFNGSTTVTITALTSGNAAVANAAVTLSVNTGVLSDSSVTTNATGQATFTFSAGTTNKANRTATITATSGTATTQLPVQVIGTTLTATPSAITLTSPTASTIVTFAAKDSGNNPIAGETITLVESGTGDVTLSATTGVTDINGNLAITVTGVTAGVRVITATGAGTSIAATITVPAVATATFGISQTVLNANPAVLNPTTVAMQIGDALVITVTAPAPTTSVIFATTVGVLNNAAATPVSGTNIVVPVSGGVATATLATAAAGTATIQVIDANSANPSVSDTLTVSMTAVTPSTITLQATPTVIPKSSGGTSGVSTLIATVKDATGQPVGGVPVAFSIQNPTGGGEQLSTVIAFTASTATPSLGLGQAITSFTSGSLSSGADGVKIRAAVPGTTVTTTAPTDAAIVIGGKAGSVFFGQATEITQTANNTAYSYAMSVIVADSNGNPAPLGTVVNLSVWPIAWSTGKNCVVDLNTATTGTFFNEDVNENLVMDASEDGRRVYTSGGTATGTGFLDGQLTPPNSAGGTLPATVITDASGVATFNLTYTKPSAIWIVDRIRASTLVSGSEAVGELVFRLRPSEADASADGTTCKLPPSPFLF